MSFHNKLLKPLNKPFELALSPFVGTVNALTRPRFVSSQKPQKAFSRSEIQDISASYSAQKNSSIEELTQKRLLEVETLLTDKLKLKPRIAVEFEFMFRDENGKPVKLTKLERTVLDKLLEKELPSFQESDQPPSPRADAEYKFDTKGKIPLSQLLEDISNFKKNLERYQVDMNLLTGIKRPKLVIDDRPYQSDRGHLAVRHDNTTSMHVNVSFENENGENVFSSDRDSLEKAVSSLLSFQLPTFALSSDKLGLDRVHKGSSSVDMIASGENSGTGSYARFGKAVSASMLSTASSLMLLVSNAGGALQSPIEYYAMGFVTLTALIADKKLVKASSSVSLRTQSENKLVSMIQKFQKRPAKTSSATRVEDRLGAANQDPALSILNTLYPIYKSLKATEASASTNIKQKKAVPQKPEELLSHALSSEKELRELYGDQLFEALFDKAVNTFLPEPNS